MAFTAESLARFAAIMPAKKKRASGMNKTEAAYAAHLQTLALLGQIKFHQYEAVTFKLAHDTRYTPDFMVLRGETLEFHDTKGFWKSTGKAHWEDDAKVKIKVAAEMFPHFRFVGVHNENGKWIEQEF